MAAERTAKVSWSGNLLSGTGKIEFTGSGALAGADMTWASRSEPDEDGRTSPEELIAAAHASCFSMALSHGLSRRAARRRTGSTFRRPRPSCPATGITAMGLDVTGRVPGMGRGCLRGGRQKCGLGELPGLAGAQGQRRHHRRRPPRELTGRPPQRLERQVRRRLLLPALVLALPLLGSSAAAAPSVPRLTGSQPCADSQGFTCSYLTVPLDHLGRAKESWGSLAPS